MGTRSKELLVTWSPEGEDMAFVQFIQPHGVPQDKVIFITKLSEEIRDLAAQGAASHSFLLLMSQLPMSSSPTLENLLPPLSFRWPSFT